MITSRVPRVADGNSGAKIAATSVPPEILVPCRRQFSVAHRVLDIAVAEVRLQSARIVALVRQRVAAGVPQHMRVSLEPEPSLDPCPLDHAGEASGSEWRSPLRSEHEGRLGFLLALEPSQGSRARLALTLLLYTGQRRGDVIRIGRQHIRDGVIHVRQQKTGIELAIPIHATLAAVIAETPADHLTLLTTQIGKPFSAAGFGNWFRDRCNEAGLRLCSAHGLRKAVARRLAEAGCTMHEIAAITGHASLSEVQRYTKAADQARLARAAMDKAK